MRLLSTRRAFWLAALAAALPGRLDAAPAVAVFQVNQAASSLTITADPPVFGAESDTQQLTGTINATFDFGTTGVLPATAFVTVTSSHVEPVGDYDFVYGLPPVFGIAVNATGLVANTTTINPPATITAAPPAIPGAYQFDASQFDIALNEGVIEVSGSINDSIDLSDEPVSGSSPVGTIGSVVFTVGGASGPYTLLNAVLTLPIDVDRTVPVGEPPQNVDLQLAGEVKAHASFYAALSGVTADFDGDADVDAADFAIWMGSFGAATGAVKATGDANGDGAAEGEDFLVWQANRGLAPPPIDGASSVPEPASMAAAMTALATSLFTKRRRATPSQNCN